MTRDGHPWGGAGLRSPMVTQGLGGAGTAQCNGVYGGPENTWPIRPPRTNMQIVHEKCGPGGTAGVRVVPFFRTKGQYLVSLSKASDAPSSFPRAAGLRPATNCAENAS